MVGQLLSRSHLVLALAVTSLGKAWPAATRDLDCNSLLQKTQRESIKQRLLQNRQLLAGGNPALAWSAVMAGRTGARKYHLFCQQERSLSGFSFGCLVRLKCGFLTRL